MNEMLEDPRLWVATAFVLFVVLSYKKIGGFVARALDQRAGKIAAELSEARRLREEAASMLAQYKQKQAEYLKEAESLLADARRDAGLLRAQAEQELKIALAARTKHALERIAQEENKAIADVRNHVVDIALAASRALIADHVATLPPDDLVKLALSDIERKIH
jgi:F-type H+-transporting ATPase subunit b